MDNSGSILDKLIGKVVFEQMKMYEAALKSAADETDKLVASVDKLIEASNKITTIEDAVKTMKKLANIEQKLNGIERERTAIINNLAEAERRRKNESRKAHSQAEKSISQTKALAEIKNRLTEIEKRLTETTRRKTPAKKELNDEEKKALLTLKETEKTRQKELKIQQMQEGSIARLKAQISALTKEYESMGKAQKEGPDGIKKEKEILDAKKELYDATKTLTDAIREQTKEQKSLDATAKESAQTKKEEAEATQKVTESVINYRNSADELTSAQIEQMNATKELTDAQKAYADSMYDFMSALDEIENSAQSYEEKLHSLLSLSVELERQQESIAGIDPFSDKAFEIAKQIEHVDAAITKLNATSGESTKRREQDGKSIAEMRDQLKRLTKEYDNMSGSMRKGMNGQALKKEIKSVSDELKVLEEETGRNQRSVGDYQIATKNIGTEIRNLTQQLAEMRAAGEMNTEAYKEAAEKLAVFKMAMQEVNREANALTNTAGMTMAVADAAKVATSAFAIFKGAMAAFGIENGTVERSIQQITASIAILNSVTQIQTALQKGSAMQTKILIPLKKGLTVAYKGLSAAIWSGTAAAKALKVALAATGIFLAVQIIAALVSGIMKWREKNKEAEKSQRELDDAVKESSKSVADTVVTVKTLQKGWNELGDDLEAKQKFVEDNKKEFEKLGVSIENVDDAQKLLVDGTEAFIESQKLAARASAARTLAQQKFAEMLELQLELEYLHAQATNATGRALKKLNKQIDETTNKMKTKGDEANRMLNSSIEATTESERALERSGLLSLQSAEADKKAADDRIKAEKIRIDTINIRIHAEAEALKKITADTKLSLDERLSAHEKYTEKQAQILRANAGIAAKEAQGDADKIALINAKLNDDLRKLNEQASDFRINEMEKLQDRITAARRKIIDMEINDELEKIKKIAENEKAGYIDRAAASQEYYDQRIKQAEENLRRELEVAGLHAEEIKALEARTLAEISKIKQDAQAQQEKILIDSMTRQIDIRRNAAKSDEMKEIADLSEEYAKGAMTRTAYEEEKLKIQQKYAQMSRDAERQAILDSIETLQTEMSQLNMEYPEMDTSAIETQIEGLKSRLYELTIETNETMDGAAEAHKNLWEKWSADLQKALKMDEQQLQEFANAMAGIVQGIGDLVSIAQQKRIDGYNEEIAGIKDRERAELEALNNAAASEEFKAMEKARIEGRAEMQRQQIEAKKKQEQLKQARFEKAWGIAQVLISV